MRAATADGKASIVERRRRLCRKHLRWRKAGESIAPSDAAHLLVGIGELINNRLVAHLALNGGLCPLLLAELEGELADVAALRLSPRGKRLKAKTIYRLLAIKPFRGSVFGRTSVRVNLWAELFTRNRRPIAEIERMAMAFHRQAVVLLSQGQSPAHLLDAMRRDDRPGKHERLPGDGA